MRVIYIFFNKFSENLMKNSGNVLTFKQKYDIIIKKIMLARHFFTAETIMPEAVTSLSSLTMSRRSASTGKELHFCAYQRCLL
ncbi:MAG TPA: hypothetical protein DCZ71_07920 [Ruminococcus sp.]|nr:hypothetical protein [Ruminococcus sp.]